jgi:AbiV family abortive infection protein
MTQPLNSALLSALSRISAGRLDKKPLQIDQVAEGTASCFRNSKELLHDAELLYRNGREQRALSVTILALEELAKVPELHDQYLDSKKRSDADSWKEFWTRFVRHQSKQGRIADYGSVFSQRQTEGPSFEWSPFNQFLAPEVVPLLDGVKQRGFYVDYAPPRFLTPSASEDVSIAFAELYAFASERIAAFGSWHATPQRALDFLAVSVKACGEDREEALKAIRLLGTFNDWASTFSPEEVRSDLVRALSYFSAQQIPDYLAFLPVCQKVVTHLSHEIQVATLASLAEELKNQFDSPIAQQVSHRAFLMFKLLLSFCAKTFDDSACHAISGYAPGPGTRAHFQGAS